MSLIQEALKRQQKELGGEGLKADYPPAQRPPHLPSVPPPLPSVSIEAALSAASSEEEDAPSLAGGGKKAAHARKKKQVVLLIALFVVIIGVALKYTLPMALNALSAKSITPRGAPDPAPAPAPAAAPDSEPA
ncbi:MAG: hypothetical protein QME60_06145, partial [Verrucomicrobiota bacterium]|nr:hypothetical protein [Verrucomicrobiota bacterium]